MCTDEICHQIRIAMGQEQIVVRVERTRKQICREIKVKTFLIIRYHVNMIFFTVLTVRV